MATTTKVLLVGATGETGRSIANGLLEAGGFVCSPPLCVLSLCLSLCLACLLTRDPPLVGSFRFHSPGIS